LATYNSSKTDTQIDAAIEKFYNCRNKITVKAPSGSTVIASCGADRLVAAEVAGLWVFYFTKFGQWTIRAIHHQTTLPVQTILIDELKDYVVNFD